MNDVLALPHVADYITKFVFSELTYEKAIRRAINKEMEIHSNLSYIGTVVYTPFYCFRNVLRYISNFSFSEKYFCKEGRGIIGNHRRPITKHDPQPRYAGYRIEVRINSQKKFRCCICSSCGEFQVKHYNSWAFFERTIIQDYRWFYIRNNNQNYSQNNIHNNIQNNSKASSKVECLCGLDGEYGSSYPLIFLNHY